MKKTKSNSLRRDDRGNAAVVLLAIVLVGITGAALLGYVALTPKGQMAVPQPGAGGGPIAAPAPPAPGVILPSTPAQMAEWNKKMTQGVSLAFTATDKTAGATTTTGQFVFWAPNIDVTGSNAPLLEQVVPGTTNTDYAVRADGFYQMAYTDDGDIFYSQSLCDEETSQLTTPCQVPIARTQFVGNPPWSADFDIRRIGAMISPVDESSTTDARNVNWANGQSNISNPEGASGGQSSSRCLTSTTYAFGTQYQNGEGAGGPGAATDGNVIGFNDTACSGSFYIEQAYECSATANRWCLRPVLHPKWSQNNGTGNEFSAVTATMAQGALFVPPGDVRSAFHTQTPIKLYPESAPWAPSTTINYIRITYAYTAANFAAGKCFDVYSDDQGSYLGWMLNQTLTGSAATSYRVCRVG